MSLQLEFRYDNQHPINIAQEIFRILQECLRSDRPLSPKEASRRIEALESVPPLFDPAAEVSPDLKASVATVFWWTLAQTVEQIPREHSGHDQVIGLLREIKSSHERTSPWHDTGMLSYAIDSIYDPSPEFLLSKFHKASHLEEWLNMDFFIARFYASGLEDPHVVFLVMNKMRLIDDGPKQKLRERLERGEMDDESLQELEEWELMGAAQMIQHNAAKLFHLMRDGEPSKVDMRFWKTSHFEGRKVMSLDRWEGWRLRLEDKKGIMINEEVKAYTARAVERMKEYEANPYDETAAQAIRERNVKEAEEEADLADGGD